MAQGSIFKEITRDGTVRWRVRVDVIDPVTGKRRQPQRTYRTRREAEAGLRQWLLEIEQGTAVDRSKQTVGEMLTRWLDSYAPYVRATTWDDYEVTVRVHLIPALGSIPVQKLTPARLEQFYAEKLASGCSERVVQLCHRRLCQALEEAVQHGVVARNPAKLVPRKKVPTPKRKEMQTWSAEQARRFLTVADQSSYGPIWLVLLGTGMRRGEALGLRWEDVDAARGTLRVAQEVVPFKGAPRIQEPKTESALRAVTVAPQIISALREHRVRQNERRLASGAQWQDHNLVFATANGNPIDPSNLRRDYTLLLGRAGVPRIRIHDQRHTHVTLAIQAGAPLGAVSKRVGHSRISTTMDLYAHVTEEMQKEAANCVNGVLFATS